MVKLDSVKKYIEVLKGKEEMRVLTALNEMNELQSSEKNAIYTYLFPKPIKHMELPELIMKNRGENNKGGFLVENDLETLILLRAYNTLQYRKFIKHLLHSFVYNMDSIYIEGGKEKYKCGSCGKIIYGFDTWKSMCDSSPDFGEQDRKEYLAYASSQSSQHLCLDCLIQYKYLDRILMAIEGKDYLSKW